MTPQTNKQRPIAVDLFAGAGGMTLGFEQAGFDVLASVEIDPVHCATHQFNFPFWSILCQSVVEIGGAQIRKQSAIGDREIDVVIGGPPCQGFSISGKRDLHDPRNELVFHFQRLVVELRPKFFAMENVPGMTCGEHKQLLKSLIDKFQSQGYQVEENYQILNAASYGVPQSRERLFLIGCRQDLELPQYPQPITSFARSQKSPRLPVSPPPLPLVPTVWDALSDLPEAEDYPELLYRDWVFAEYGKPSDYARQLRGFSPLEDDYSYQREWETRFLCSSLRTKHTLKSIKRFAKTSQGHTEPISHFHKLHPEGICNTLRAGTDRQRGSFTAPRPIHPFTPRCITVREAARLHSYPDWFRFHATKWHGFRQVGNSVPPLLAKAVAGEIIRALGAVPLKPNITQVTGVQKLLQLSAFQAYQRYLREKGRTAASPPGID